MIIIPMSLQKVTVYADGSTEPEVASGTPIILIQNGEVEVGRLVLEEDDYGSNSIEHPSNSEDLKREAFDAVRKEPALLVSEKAVIVVCPQSLSSKMIW
ncbi:hypothetical protein [Hymenobacter properus]|uniref:Uncharacterized protein n=1 Tax=Hymenobacter properus TaxID=2791026 RepID=A0A931FNU7_9BACT|nr:hypothetical protein [Hymenobacter properus]MBF9142994.1 hypothetical protein [Hymenobacter properus]MBR7721801.1 hypothetical protein [Microvirga sp. SRT04]